MKKAETKGSKSVLNSLFRISQGPEFKLLVKDIRAELKLPGDGILLPKNEHLYSVATQFDFEGYIHTNKTTQKKVEDADLIYKKVECFLEKKGFYYWGFIELLLPFIHISDISKRDFFLFAKFHDARDLDACSISTRDFIAEEALFLSRMKYDQDEYLDSKKLFESDNRRYPVIIQISNFASINQIIDFIRKNKNTIIDRQTKSSALTPIMSRSSITEKKYSYIWVNREIYPRKKLAEMVNTKFNSKHDAIYIRNIISKQNNVLNKR